MGARISLEKGGSDLYRIERHKILLRSLVEQNFDFRRIIENGDYYSTYGGNVFEDLRQVRPEWRFDTLGSLKHAKKGRMQVVVRMSPFHPRSMIRRLFRLSRDAF